MRIISWNLNGLPATLESGCLKAVEKLRPDVLCLQEIRTEREPNIIKIIGTSGITPSSRIILVR